MRKLNKQQVVDLLNSGQDISDQYIDHLLDSPFYIATYQGSLRYYANKWLVHKNAKDVQEVFLEEVL